MHSTKMQGQTLVFQQFFATLPIRKRAESRFEYSLNDFWAGIQANHQSLASFQKQLEGLGIKLSTAKIRKILITGGRWTTERSREVAELYEKLGSVAAVAKNLEVSEKLVIMYLPYNKVVYDLEEKSGNAKRMDRWRAKQRDEVGHKDIP